MCLLLTPGQKGLQLKVWVVQLFPLLMAHNDKPLLVQMVSAQMKLIPVPDRVSNSYTISFLVPLRRSAVMTAESV